MAMTRRGFLAAAALGAGAAMSARAEGEKLRVCIIGDTKNGGYGHDLHLSWALRGGLKLKPSQPAKSSDLERSRADTLTGRLAAAPPET